MKRFIIRVQQGILVSLLGAVMVVSVHPKAQAAISPGIFDQSKYAMLVVDASSGTVLYQQNAGKPRYPASLTKLMTLYLTFDALDRGRLRLNQNITVSKHAAAQPPSKLGLRPGSTISVQDAILALIVKSSNDIAVALAEAIGGTENGFGTLMTQKARQLGMYHSTFVNASGLPDTRQKTTAYDMTRLAMALYRNHRKYYPLFSRTQHNYKGMHIATHNRVLKAYRGADGLKTGYINASGFNLVTSAERNGKRLIGVVLGGNNAANRDTHMMDMLNKGFAQLGVGNTGTYTASNTNSPVPQMKPATESRNELAAAQIPAATPAPAPAAVVEKPVTIASASGTLQVPAARKVAISKAVIAQHQPVPAVRPAVTNSGLQLSDSSVPAPIRKPYTNY